MNVTSEFYYSLLHNIFMEKKKIKKSSARKNKFTEKQQPAYLTTLPHSLYSLRHSVIFSVVNSISRFKALMHH